MIVDMLTAALPFVSGKMRRPLALYVKSTQMHQLFSDSDDQEILTACGLEETRPDPEAMLKAMKAAGGTMAPAQIDQLLQMINTIKTYQKITEMLERHPEIMQLLSSMNHQTPNNGFPSKNNSPQTGDLFKQLESPNSSDIMSFLSQMLKNSR